MDLCQQGAMISPVPDTNRELLSRGWCNTERNEDEGLQEALTIKMNRLVLELVCRELKMTDGAVIDLKKQLRLARNNQAKLRPTCACRYLTPYANSATWQKN